MILSTSLESFTKLTNIKIISQTEEKYFSITARVEGTNIQFEFKDSLKFLLKSIDKSAQVLYDKDKAGIKNFKNLTSYFKDLPVIQKRTIKFKKSITIYNPGQI
jgi:hypothetical protein